MVELSMVMLCAQISYWVANEIVTVPNLSKRVHILQSIISLASVRNPSVHHPDV
jgi:hypothetical protein